MKGLVCFPMKAKGKKQLQAKQNNLGAGRQKLKLLGKEVIIEKF